MKLKRNLIFVLAALLFGLITLPVLAQEVEPTPEATVIVVPDEPQPVVDPPAPPVPEGSIVLPAWQLFAFVFTGFLSGGTIGIVGVGMIAKNIMNNPAALKNAEDVGNSVPQQTANKLIDLADSAIAIATLAKEMLDRVPASGKPTVEKLE